MKILIKKIINASPSLSSLSYRWKEYLFKQSGEGWFIKRKGELIDYFSSSSFLSNENAKSQEVQRGLQSLCTFLVKKKSSLQNESSDASNSEDEEFSSFDSSSSSAGKAEEIEEHEEGVSETPDLCSSEEESAGSESPAVSSNETAGQPEGASSGASQDGFEKNLEESEQENSSESSGLEESAQGSSENQTAERSGEEQISSSFSEKGNGDLEICSSFFSEKYRCGGGGGSQASFSSASLISSAQRRIKEFLSLLSSEQDISSKVEGFDYFDSRKMVKARLNPSVISNAKYSRPKLGGVYFFVDVSGSVSYLAEFILNLLFGGISLEGIRVFIGSEAHPEREILAEEKKNLKEILDDWWKKPKNSKIFFQEYGESFDADLEGFLKKCKPSVGSVFVFFGDLHDIHIKDPKKVKKLLAPYKSYWLHTHEDKPCYSGCEIERAKKAGFNMLFEVNSEEGLLRAIRKVRR